MMSALRGTRQMSPKALRIGIVATIAILALVAFLPTSGWLRHKTVLKAYFTDGMGLRAGAPVRLAGVEIGSVRSVRVRPELKSAPVEVVMVLTPSYKLDIPNDSVASLATAGILGETYVRIDTTNASGLPVAPDAVIRTLPTTGLSPGDVIEKFDQVVTQKLKDLDEAAKKCNCDAQAKEKSGTTASPRNSQ